MFQVFVYSRKKLVLPSSRYGLEKKSQSNTQNNWAICTEEKE